MIQQLTISADGLHPFNGLQLVTLNGQGGEGYSQDSLQSLDIAISSVLLDLVQSDDWLIAHLLGQRLFHLGHWWAMADLPSHGVRDEISVMTSYLLDQGVPGSCILLSRAKHPGKSIQPEASTASLWIESFRCERDNEIA